MTNRASNFMLMDRQRRPIDNWEKWTPPKESYQWQHGHSAMEFAKAWFRRGSLACPDELLRLLRSSIYTIDCQLIEGSPEFVTSLPIAGEGRNHDLWLKAVFNGKPLTICVEAKADEPFGETVLNQITKAEAKNPATGIPRRASALLELLFHRQCDPREQPWSDLRYQLLTAAAGTVRQAVKDGATLAMFVVHEFQTWLTTPEKLALNNDDLLSFVKLLAPSMPPLSPGELIGPIRIHAGKYLRQDVDLLIGKAVATCPR